MDAKQFNINGTTVLLKDESARNRIAAVEGKLPSDASSSNKLITKTVDDLLYYYLKSETYTKSEVEALIGAIQHFHYEVYASTSAVTNPASNVLYLIGPTGGGADKYEEYVYSNNTWVKIGDTSIDLSGYVTTEALNTALAAYTTTANLTTLLAGKQDVISDLATIRSGAAAGATAYQKPSGGIPKTDLASGVQDSLDLADESLQYTLSGQVDPSVTPGSYVTRSDIVDNLTTDDATKILSAKQGKVLGDAVSQLGQEVSEQNLSISDAEVHQVNAGSETETPSGTRLRLLFYVYPGYIVSASCSLGSGVAAGVYSSDHYALYAGDSGLKQSIRYGYVASFEKTEIFTEGYLSISLKKSDDSSFTEQEKADYLAATTINVVYSGLIKDTISISDSVGIIKDNMGEIPTEIVAKDLGYSKENAVIWSGFDSNNNTVSTVGPFIPLVTASGIVTKIKANFATSGTFTIGKIKKTDAVVGETFDISKVITKKVYVVPAIGVKEIEIEPMILLSDEDVLLGFPGDEAKFLYGPNGTNAGFKYLTTNRIIVTSSKSLGVDISGYKTKPNATALVYDGLLSNTDALELLGIDTTGATEIYQSVATSGGSNSVNANSPFIVYKEFNQGILTKISINISSPGTLTFGKVKKSDVVLGETFDRTKVYGLTAITFIETGLQDVYLVNFILKSDEYFFVGVPTDTALFKYGGTGATDSGFVYMSSGKATKTLSSLGVDIYEKQIKNLSFYNGKKLSILGDSISTFSGYIPSGNVAYYPAGTVTSVQDTWWKKLIDALGLVLDTNNSWSGSRVTTTDSEISAGCMTRAQNLGNPDVIIVWMGINDFNNEVAIGTYDGKSDIPSITTTFREAYGIMLNKILTAYPMAEVWVCTLPQCERNGSTGFPETNGNGVALVDFNIAIEELARAFGVKVLDHNRCGLTYQNMSVFNPDQLHPNKYGHSLVANNDIRQMDSFVTTRYSIK